MSDAVRQADGRLYDNDIGAAYSLSDDAQKIIGLLAAKGGALVSSAKAPGIPFPALLNVLRQLNTIGVLRFKDNGLGTRLRRVRLRIWTRKRYKPTLRDFALGMLYAYGFAWLIAGVPCAWFLVMSSKTSYAYSSLLVITVLFGSCVAHELGHTIAARMLGIRAAIIVGFASAAVLCAPSHAFFRRTIAVSGPVLGAATCGLSALLPLSTTVRSLIFSCMLAHLLHVLPLCADGNLIWKGGK